MILMSCDFKTKEDMDIILSINGNEEGTCVHTERLTDKILRKYFILNAFRIDDEFYVIALDRKNMKQLDMHYSAYVGLLEDKESLTFKYMDSDNHKGVAQLSKKDLCSQVVKALGIHPYDFRRMIGYLLYLHPNSANVPGLREDLFLVLGVNIFNPESIISRLEYLSQETHCILSNGRYKAGTFIFNVDSTDLNYQPVQEMIRDGLLIIDGSYKARILREFLNSKPTRYLAYSTRADLVEKVKQILGDECASYFA